MTKRVLLLALSAIAACQPAPAKPRCEGPACGGTLVLIGTEGTAPGAGIHAARLDPATGALSPLGLAAELPRSTWLERDPTRPIVYALTGSVQSGAIASLAVDPGAGRLSVRSRVPTGGAAPTHMTYDRRHAMLFVAHYGDGKVAAIPVAQDGTLAPPAAVATDPGSGPNPRQAGPHAHAAVVDPAGRFVLVPDLGADRVYVYRWDAAGRTLGRVGEAPFAPGSGPRHLAFSRDGRLVYVLTELTAQLETFRWDGQRGVLTPLAKVALDPASFAGTKSGCEVALSPDGRFVYVSNRGTDEIQVFAVDRATGTAREIQRIGCGGKVPRSFAIDPSGRWMLVANQGSGNVAMFAVDRATGRLRATGTSLAVPGPMAFVFFS